MPRPELSSRILPVHRENSPSSLRNEGPSSPSSNFRFKDSKIYKYIIRKKLKELNFSKDDKSKDEREARVARDAPATRHAIIVTLETSPSRLAE